MVRRIVLLVAITLPVAEMGTPLFAQSAIQAVPAQPTPAPAATGAPAAPHTGALVVIGLPSVIEEPRSLLGMLFGDNSTMCADFSLSSFGHPTPQLRIATSGIGGALLVDQPEPNRPCSSTARSADELDLANLDEAAHAFRLMLPAAAFPELATGAKGKILLLRPDMPAVEAPITLKRQDYAPFARAALWFLGIFVPAAITGVIGALLYSFQKARETRNADKQELGILRQKNAQRLGAFFKGLYANTIKVTADNDKFRDDMTRELTNEGILAALPPEPLARVMKAMQRYDRKQLAEELAAVFPEHKDAIMAPLAKEEA